MKRDENDKDNVAIYNTLSILFNTIKYYNYYKQYLQTPNKDSKYEFLRFWNKAEAEAKKSEQKGVNDNSLIIQLMKFIKNENGKTQFQLKENPFQNEYLEQIFMRNLDTLDVLQDYLPLKNQNIYDKSEDDLFGQLIIYYEKLSEFQFYLYPKEKGKNKDNEPIKFDVFSIICSFLKEVKQSNSAKQCFLDIFKGESQTR